MPASPSAAFAKHPFSPAVIALDQAVARPVAAPSAPPPEPPAPPERLIQHRDPRPLGQILLEDDAVTSQNLLKAVVMRQRQDAPLGEILLAHGWVTEAALTRALSRQWRTSVIDLAAMPPDPRLLDLAGVDLCLAAGLVPWRRIGGVTYVVTSRPESFAKSGALLPAEFGDLRMLLCAESAMREAILGSRRTALIRRAETRVPLGDSCRNRNEARTARIATATIAALVLGMILAPVAMLSIVTAWALLTLIATMTVKVLAFATVLREDARTRRAASV